MLYDPVSGQNREGTEKDIDTWLLDIDHDGESFFAHRIHFPNQQNDSHLKRLKQAIANNLDPDQWANVFSTESTPFKKPAHHKIAVRIITTAGVEMTCVRDIE